MSGLQAQRAQLRAPPDYPHEFTCTEVDILCASMSKGTLKKARKDKRESHNSRALLDDNSRKLKERPSWLSIPRQPSSSMASAGSWRQVTCNLQDDVGQAILHLYTEDPHPHSSIEIHTLFAPNIRITDPTLLVRRHVLGIYNYTCLNNFSVPAVGPPASPEPIYLAFRDHDTLNTWFTLLRSFARPDIRPYAPTNYSPPHPIPYRISRQLQVTVIDGRKFPSVPSDKFLPEDNSLTVRGKDKDGDPSKDRIDIFIEVVLNGMVVGRTGTKQVNGPAWHAERIIAHDPDLGGGNWAGSGGVAMDFTGAVLDAGWGVSGAPNTNSSSLELRVWRAKAGVFGSPPMHIATVPIDLGPFRRGEAVKGWWPGYPVGGRGMQDGELNLEIKFDEDMVMPLETYRTMKEILARRNYFELWQQLTERVALPNIVSQHLISLAQHHATLAPHLSALARAEINDPRASPTTLFRGNTTLTRAAEVAMGLLGARGFLENSIGGVVRRIYKDKVVFDIGTGGPSGSNAGGAVGITEGVDTMAHWLQEIWNSIWRARGDCPEELRQLFYQIRTQIDVRWGASHAHADLKYQAISAFIFLRFFVPALLRPDQNGIAIGAPPEGVGRTLKSLARALQSLANLNTNVQREEFMRSIKSFNENNVDAMIDYLISVSTPSERLLSSPTSHPNVHHQHHLPPRQSDIHTALRVRMSAMAPIHRESLAVLPHLFDEARALAAIASAVVRHASIRKEPWLGGKQGLGLDVDPMDDVLGAEQGESYAGQAFTNDLPTTEITRGEDYSETQIDVLRLVRACFDIETEIARRISPQAEGKKKQAKRRRRPTTNKPNEKPIREERVGLGFSPGSGPSAEARSPKERVRKELPPPLPIAELAAYESLSIPASELDYHPEFERQVSYAIPLEAVSTEASGSKPRRRGVLPRWMRI